MTSIDVSADSVGEARRRVDAAGLADVELRQADVFALPFPAGSFDHVFVCFVLEHRAARGVGRVAVQQLLERPGLVVQALALARVVPMDVRVRHGRPSRAFCAPTQSSSSCQRA